MKCPTCKAWADVQESVLRKDGSRRRTYKCANLHKFITLEQVAVVPPGSRQAVVLGRSSTPIEKEDALSTLPRVDPRMPRLLMLDKP